MTTRVSLRLPPLPISTGKEELDMHLKIQQEPTILRRRHVEQRTGLSRSTLCQYMKDAAFPKPVQLGLRAVGWLESDISKWIAARVKVGRLHRCNAARARGKGDAAGELSASPRASRPEPAFMRLLVTLWPSPSMRAT